MLHPLPASSHVLERPVVIWSGERPLSPGWWKAKAVLRYSGYTAALLNMAVPLCNVIWNDHANEFTTTCSSLLENEFFVDCTIAAEGRSLKAHKLILCACSSYFRELFNEVREEHPVVILTDTSFRTLETVIDFVYCGKVEIPANQFEAFWELAVSLQIKGLNNSVPKHRGTDNDNSGDRNALQHLLFVNEGVCEDGSSCKSQEHCHPSPSQQHHSDLPYGYTATVQTATSGAHEGCCVFGKKVESGAMGMSQRNNENCPVHNGPNISVDTEIIVKSEPLHSECEILGTENEELGHESGSVPKDSEVLINTEISAKREPLYSESEFLVTENKILDDVNQEEPKSENIRTEINELSPSFDQDLDQLSCDGVCLDAIGNSALQQAQQGRQHVRHLSCEACSLEQGEECSLFPCKHLRAKREKTDDAEGEESLGGQDVAGGGTDEMDRRIESPFEQKLISCSMAESILPDDGQAIQWPSKGESSSLPAPLEQQEQHLPRSPENRKSKHLVEPLYPCGLCRKTFSCRSSLTRHMRTHSEECSYKCDLCRKDFCHRSALICHKRTHSGERPYKCDVCGKTFAVPYTLTRHMRTHSGERPYKCSVCGKAFASLSTLAKHMRSHSGDRSYNCDVCRKVFSDRSYLICHMRTHSGERPYKCTVCGKSFTVPGNLKKHIRTHSGERPYKCDLCGMAFSVSSNLTKHMRTHFGDRPYKCNVCRKSFTVSSDLTKHMHIHSGEHP